MIFRSPAADKSLLSAPGMFTSDGGITGNHADFIIDAQGRIAFAQYGRHYADSLDAGQIAAIKQGETAKLAQQ